MKRWFIDTNLFLPSLFLLLILPWLFKGVLEANDVKWFHVSWLVLYLLIPGLVYLRVKVGKSCRACKIKLEWISKVTFEKKLKEFDDVPRSRDGEMFRYVGQSAISAFVTQHYRCANCGREYRYNVLLGWDSKALRLAELVLKWVESLGSSRSSQIWIIIFGILLIVLFSLGAFSSAFQYLMRK